MKKKNLSVPHREKIKGKYYVIVRDKKSRIDQKERWGPKHLKLTQAIENFNNDEINAINPDKPRRRLTNVTFVYNFESTKKPHGKAKRFAYIIEATINKTKIYGQSEFFTIKSDLAIAKKQAWNNFYKHLSNLYYGSYDVKKGKEIFIKGDFDYREGIIYYRGDK